MLAFFSEFDKAHKCSRVDKGAIGGHVPPFRPAAQMAPQVAPTKKAALINMMIPFYIGNMSKK